MLGVGAARATSNLLAGSPARALPGLRRREQHDVLYDITYGVVEVGLRGTGVAQHVCGQPAAGARLEDLKRRAGPWRARTATSWRAIAAPNTGCTLGLDW